MMRKGTLLFTLILCLGLLVIMAGCSKKQIAKDTPAVSQSGPGGIEEKKDFPGGGPGASSSPDKPAQDTAGTRRDLLLPGSGQPGGEKPGEGTQVAKKSPDLPPAPPGPPKDMVAIQRPEGQHFETEHLKPIFFNFDKADVRPMDAETLKENAAYLMKNPAMKIQIEGHCDERGTEEYNLALGERRAANTKKYLLSLGISPDRISTISYGEARPFDRGQNEGAWGKNRRAHFIILPK